jgi:hypothetical protein
MQNPECAHGAVCGKGLQVPYLHIDVSFGTAIGQTVDATIGKAQVRVTLISEEWIRIELDAENEAAGFCRIFACTSQDGRMTICADPAWEIPKLNASKAG